MTERKSKWNILVLKSKATMVISNIVIMVLLFGLCFMILQPLMNKIALSLMEEQDLYDNTIVTIPKHFTLFNYELAIYGMDYWNSLLETFLICLGVAGVEVIAALLVGYGFARYSFPLKKFWFTLVILLIVIPPQTYSSAIFLHFRYFDIFGLFKALTGDSINLTGSSLPLFLLGGTCTGLKNGLYVYMFRQYFRNIPKDIEESAYLDGCGAFGTLFRIMLPDAIPLATSCCLFSFVWHWTDNYYGSLLMKSSNLLAVRVNGLSGAIHNMIMNQNGAFAGHDAINMSAYYDCISATATILLLIPVIIVYLIAQKRFVESLNSTAVKM